MLGKRMRELRLERQITLKQLGEKLNLGESTMSMYENDRRNPDYDTLIQLSNIFDCSIDYLLGKTDRKESADKIEDALEDDEELSNFWHTMKNRPELKLMFKQTKDLSPKAIQQVIRIIKAIEDEEEQMD